MKLRPAELADAEVCAQLILETPGGLEEIVEDRAAALRAARAAFASPRTAMSFVRTLVAEGEGSVLGQVIRFPGAEWRRLRIGTALAMLRGAGLRFGARLAWRGPVEDRLIPPVPPRALYVISLAVRPDARGRGIGTALLRAAVEEAMRSNATSVALDVASSNEGAIRLYRREGFRIISEQRVPARRGLPAMRSLRMELEDL